MEILYWILIFVVFYHYIGMIFETFLEEKGYLHVCTFQQFIFNALVWPILLVWYLMDR